MSNSVLTNSSALMALQNLNRTNERLNDVQGRINTGLKVRGAKDNASVWAIAQNQRADMGALEAVTSSLNRATSLADVSLAAGESISDLLIELKKLATAAADPSATAESRQAYDDEFQALLTSVTSFAANATFDGENILDGASTTVLSFLANADASESIDVDRQDFTLTGLSINGLDLTSSANADTALTAVSTAIATASSRLATLGAQA
jgi:flagellin